MIQYLTIIDLESGTESLGMKKPIQYNHITYYDEEVAFYRELQSTEVR